MGVEGRDGRGDRAEVSVQELAQPPVVVLRAPDVELEVRNAEGVLHVDGNETESEAVVEGGSQAVLLAPRLGFERALLIRDAPNLADSARVEVRR